MNSEKLNRRALYYLQNDNIKKAQENFLKNAYTYPSYKTYNNLGVFLIDYGIHSKNKKVLSANKLGFGFLLKSLKLHNSHLTFCAIAQELNRRSYGKIFCKKFYKKVLSYLIEAQKICYSHEILYNILRMKYLLGIEKSDILKQNLQLVEVYTSPESVGLCLELLTSCSNIDKGIKFLKKYNEYLEKYEVIMFCAKYKLYDMGYNLCESVFKEYVVDNFMFSAMLECCICSEHLIEAKEYVKKIIENSDVNNGCNKLDKKILEDIEHSSIYRRKFIDNYSLIPPYIEHCCYFGCEMHKNTWAQGTQWDG